MAGVREDGILQTTGGGGSGTAVDIVSPIGPNTAANSVSVTIATDEGPIPVSSTAPVNTTAGPQNLNVLNEEVTITVPDGYNSVTAIVSANAFTGILAGIQGTFASGIFTSPAQGYDFTTGIWNSSFVYAAATNRKVLSFPVVSGKQFSIAVASYTGGSADVELIASQSLPLGAPLTNTELRASALLVNTELNAAAALTDNQANPTTANVGANLMLLDGAAWDRAPGNSTDGLLVNLGANNDVTIPGGVSVINFPIATPLADNTANPTTTMVGANGMLWDGATWDRSPGNSVDGTLVNLGANNDVDTELPPAVALSDILANPTAPAVGAYGLHWNGAVWQRLTQPLTDVQLRSSPVPVSGTVSAQITSPLVAGAVNPSYAGDSGVIVASRDVVNTITSTLSNPGNRVMPIGMRDISTETIRHIPGTLTPWTVGAFGNPVVFTRDLGATATQSTTLLNALNATVAFNCAENNINAAVVIVSNTGSFVGTITPRIGASDGVFRNTTAFKLSDGTPATTLELNTPYVIYTAGLYYFELRVTAYTSGSANGYAVATNCASVVYGSVNVSNDITDTIPMGALVTDTPQSYLPDTKQPLSLTSEGRLRVSSVDSTIDKAWTSFSNNPWDLPSTVEPVSAWN